MHKRGCRGGAVERLVWGCSALCASCKGLLLSMALRARLRPVPAVEARKPSSRRGNVVYLRVITRTGMTPAELAALKSLLAAPCGNVV